jgi:sterol desaturase/sphingolipid hydroxylase (fatty acid hydroxylase superfamily)
MSPAGAVRQGGGMLDAALHWYAAHAPALFAGLLVTAVAMEQLHHRLTGRADDESAFTSLVSGVAFMAVKQVVGKLAFTTLALIVFERFRLFTLDLANPLTWIGMFVARDAVYYWVHRAEHRVRVLWASHMVHHSPETIGFTTAIRVPWMEAVYKPWFGLWVPLFGFHPVAMVLLDVLAAIVGQLYHTEKVRRIPLLEHVFVTPAAHRVHHGSNPEYIDKNFGAVLIVWDKLFGTFEPEVAPVRYGIGRKKIDTPTKALVGGYPALARELRGVSGASAKVRYALAPPA